MTVQRPELVGTKPLVLFKTGVLGCHPYDFIDELADVMGAAVVSSDEVRQAAVHERGDATDPFRIRNDDVQREIRLRVGTLLGGIGSSFVIVDAFYNSPRTRDAHIGTFARDNWAHSVGMNFTTPHDLSLGRVKDWVFAGQVGRFTAQEWEQASRSPVDVSRFMSETVEPIADEELGAPTSGVDYAIDLDGRSNTIELVASAVQKLETLGLVKA